MPKTSTQQALNIALLPNKEQYEKHKEELKTSFCFIQDYEEWNKIEVTAGEITLPKSWRELWVLWNDTENNYVKNYINIDKDFYDNPRKEAYIFYKKANFTLTINEIKSTKKVYWR